MIKTFVKKAVSLLITIFLITLMSFVLTRIAPVDPAETYVRMHTIQVTDEAIAKIREDMGLNDPIVLQYIHWLQDAINLNFGTSLMTGNSVAYEFAVRAPKSIALVGVSAGVQIVFILLFGFALYMTENRFPGKLLQYVLLVIMCIPTFLIGLLFLDLFGVKLGLISVLGSGVIPPAICTAAVIACFYGKMLHENLHRHMNSDWAEYARLRGLSETRILFSHALPHALTILLPSYLQMLGKMLAGVGIIEMVFSYRGIGNLMMEGIVHHDAPVINAAVLLLVSAVLICDLISDVIKWAMNRRLPIVQKMEVAG